MRSQERALIVGRRWNTETCGLQNIEPPATTQDQFLQVFLCGQYSDTHCKDHNSDKNGKPLISDQPSINRTLSRQRSKFGLIILSQFSYFLRGLV